jgi:molybdate transport repressor ModE-like protein
MARRGKKAPAYKDITLQQLRSFCETARHGSLTAAATVLGLAHPTVWKQVHALEQTLGVPLVEPHARGCKLTAAGELLTALVSPNVANLDNLRRRFEEAIGRIDVRITVASAPRLLAEDVCPALGDFFQRWPQARLKLSEMTNDLILQAVAGGEAEFGLTLRFDARETHTQLSIEPWYALDVILLAPRDHPLAKKRLVRPEDLREYPLLNSLDTLGDPEIHAAVAKLGLFETGPRSVEARQTSIIRRCVEEGLGIALVIGRQGETRQSLVHERVMSQHFGKATVHLVRRRDVDQHPAVEDLTSTIRKRLGK